MVESLRYYIFTLLQEYAKYNNRIGPKEMYKIMLMISLADLAAKKKRYFDNIVIHRHRIYRYNYEFYNFEEVPTAYLDFLQRLFSVFPGPYEKG